MYLLLEDENAVCLNRVVALVRSEQGTAIVMTDNTRVHSAFTPRTLDKRSRKFWTNATNRWKEQQPQCLKKH